MFIDEAEINVQAGNGGNGVVAFFPMKKGPCGGDGGNGGDIYAVGDPQMADLNMYSSVSLFKAEDGKNGESFNKTGAAGKDRMLRLPIGTSIIHNSQEIIEIKDSKTMHLLAKGCSGGRGNRAFASATNQVPRRAEAGVRSEILKVQLVLKLIADYGIIGLPNAGKSTLLNELTNANVKTAMYEFTTLEPNLGVMGKKVIADIPGLIEGASRGKGLGVKFLKHIEKVPVLLHCIAGDAIDPLGNYKTVMFELENYNKLLVKKEQIIILCKTDMITPQKYRKLSEKLQIFGYKVLPFSKFNPAQFLELKKFLES